MSPVRLSDECPFTTLRATKLGSGSKVPSGASGAWPAEAELVRKVFTLVWVLPQPTADDPEPKVLLGCKTRGPFKGLFNGFGGKVDPTDASPLAGATRELIEEAGIIALDMRYRGRILYTGRDEGVVDVRLFSCTEWEGEPVECEEMGVPTWYSIADECGKLPPLPYDAMFEDQRHYLPHLLAGKNIAVRADYSDSIRGEDGRVVEGSYAWWVGELVPGEEGDGALVA